jgi:DNA-binding FadR family transcriptional regulator
MSELFAFDLQRDQLYMQVAERLQHLIVAESLKLGDQLPGERELAKRLGVSRTVVREATRVLAERGLLKVKQGCGTFVCDLNLRDAAAPFELLIKMQKCPDVAAHLTEVRSTIEVEIAGLAAERATAEDQDRLTSALAAMRAHQSEPRCFAEHDLVFHLALASATHNAFYGLLLQAISSLLSEAIVLSLAAPGATEAGLRHHERVLSAIQARDGAAARQAMLDHLQTSATLLSAVQTG